MFKWKGFFSVIFNRKIEMSVIESGKMNANGIYHITADKIDFVGIDLNFKWSFRVFFSTLVAIINRLYCETLLKR